MPEARRQLTERICAAIAGSEGGLQPQPIDRVAWQTRDALLEPRTTFTDAILSRGSRELLAG
jgi:hypothetical protein